MKRLFQLGSAFILVTLAAFTVLPLLAQVTIKGSTVVTGGTGSGGAGSLATYSKIGTVAGGVCYVSPYTITTDAFAAFNACLSQLPAAGGTIDAVALGTSNYAVTTPLTAINTPGTRVSLLLNPGTTFTLNQSFSSPSNSPASCAIPIGQGSSLTFLGGTANPSSPNVFVGSSAVIWDGVCNGDFSGAQNALNIYGLNIQGNSSASVSGALIHMKGLFNGTPSIENSSTSLCAAQCTEFDSANTGAAGTGNLLLLNDQFTDGASSGTYPGSVVGIDAVNSTGEFINITFLGGSIKFNGPHNPLVTINGRGSIQASTVAFINTGFVTAPATTSAANPNVDPVQITDAAQIYFSSFHLEGLTNSAAQGNAIDIAATVPNQNFGITINDPSVYTAAGFTHVINNLIEGTVEDGYPNGAGDTVLPNYFYGQVVPQIRQSAALPPATPGQCVPGSLWLTSSGTTVTTTAYVCTGGTGTQTYQALGGGGGGGGPLGTLPFDLLTNNPGNTAAADSFNFQATGANSPQAAVNAAASNNGVATLNPAVGTNAPFTNTANVKVHNDANLAADYRSVTEFGAQCNTRTVSLTFNSGSPTVTIHNDFFYLADIGKSIAAVGTVGGIPTAFETTIASVPSNGSSTATMTINAPFNQTSAAPSPLGTDDTATIQQAFNQAKTPPSSPANLQSTTTLTFPASACLTHTINYTGVSFVGLDPVKSNWVGFPGETILLAPDPSLGTAAPGNGVTIGGSGMTASVDNRIDATLPWQIINNSGTTSKTALYQPAGLMAQTANNPLAPGWMQGARPNLGGAIAGVCAINSGSPTLCTVPAGLTLPVATNTIVFPYLSSVFTTTVASVNTGTRVVTLTAGYTGSTASQISWFAGTSVQKLGANYSGSGCPTTMTLTNPITPAPGFESNVAPFGLVQVGAEQFTYFGRTNAGNLGSQFLTITGCAQNGTSRAAHSTNDTVVPLNPYKPATPWPVTPTVNAGATTPVNAAYYPAWNVGNGFYEAPVADGTSSSSATGSFANAVIENITINSYPTSDPFNHNAGLYIVSLPYSTTFRHITAAQTYFGIEESVPAFNAGGGWAAAQPTADATHWEGIRISSCNVMDMVAGNQNSYKDFNVYSNCENSSGTGLGAQTGYYFTYGWNDETGGILSSTNHSYFSNMYVEHESGALAGVVPGMELDGFDNKWDDIHVGSGTETYLGGAGNRWIKGNFNVANNLPVINMGTGNGSDGVQLLSSGDGVCNTYGSCGFINYGGNSSFSGPSSNARIDTAPQTPMQLLNSREPSWGQTNETFTLGNTTAPFINSNGGYIPASEFSTNGMFEANPFQVGWYYDATSFSGGSVGCNVTTGSLNCLAYQWNNVGIEVGPGQRIAAGKYTMYLQIKSTGTASTVQLQVGVCSPDDTATLTVPVTSSYTWYQAQVDLTGKGSCGGSIALGFGFASANDTISVGAVDFAPVAQQPVFDNLNLLTSLFLNGTAGTTGQVPVVQSDGTLRWGAGGGFANPMTTLGDMIYGGASGTPTRLAGNTSATPAMIVETGTGSAAQAPVVTPATGTGSPVLATAPSVTAPSWTGGATGDSLTLTGPATGIAGLGTATYALGSTGQVGTGASSPACVTTSPVTNCDSLSGTFSFTTGTGSLAAGTIVTVTLPGTRTYTPTCQVTMNSATYHGIFALPVNTAGTVTLPITVAVALSASTTYTIAYGVCGGV